MDACHRYFRVAINIDKLLTLLGAAVALRKRNSATPLVGRSAQIALVRFQDLDEDRQLLVAR